jgi:hypothetical protein
MSTSPETNAVEPPALMRFTFLIEGANVRPETVKARDLMELLRSFESALTETARGSGADPQTLHFSLVGVAPGSNRLDIAVDLASERAAALVAEAVERKESDLLPQPAIFHLIALQKKAHARDWRIHFHNGHFGATIQPDDKLFANAHFQGQTRLFAQILKVGGPRPRAQLLLTDKSKLAATVDGRELAQRLGRFLYKWVTLEGIARWSAKTFLIREFKITALGEYQDDEADPVAAFDALRTAAAGKWNDVDPDEYVHELRDDDAP